MGFRYDVIIDNLPLLLKGAVFTVEITALSVGLGMLIGLVLSIMRLSDYKAFRWVAAIYVDFIRGTPLLVQIFIIFFALPQFTGIKLDPFAAAVAACGINSGAYVAEIFRAGIQSIEQGQMEAGRSLGLSWVKTMRYIIVPQAFRVVIPPLGNEFITLLKDSSLVSVIGFQELVRSGQLIIARTYAATEIWLMVALIYLIMTISISQLVLFIERRSKVNGRA